MPYTSPKAAMDIGFALKMAKAGKAPNPLKPHRGKLDEVRKLHKLLKAEEKIDREAKRTEVTIDREQSS